MFTNYLDHLFSCVRGLRRVCKNVLICCLQLGGARSVAGGARRSCMLDGSFLAR
jgi:hypothetical protein